MNLGSWFLKNKNNYLLTQAIQKNDHGLVGLSKKLPEENVASVLPE